MKVITRIVIRMSDGSTISEDSYEYHGPVAECKKGGGGESKTDYVQSPEARQIMNMFMPSIQRIAQAGAPGAPTGYGQLPGGYGQAGGVTGKMGSMPGIGGQPQPYGGPSGTLWDVGGYDVPSVSGMMPSEATMGAISPEVRAGVMAPYKEAEQQLMETLGAGGGLGSARGGFSGQGAAGLGKYWADAGQQYGQDLWGMVAPAQQAGWGAELGQAKDVWSQELMAKQFPYTVIPGMAGSSMPSPVVSQGGGKK